MNDTVKMIAARLQIEQGVKFNPEQYEFITTEPGNIKSESLPGTGKTFSVINRMLVLELGYQIPGEQILAMSFTNMATAELEVKHKNLCNLLDLRSTPRFSTLHSICSKIIRDNYDKLGIEYYKPVSESYDIISADCEYMRKKAESELGLILDARQIRNVYNCIKTLNSSLIFDPTHIATNIDFIKLKMRMSDFTHLRSRLYNFRKLMSEVLISDITLYALELLQEFPEISEEYKKKYHTVIVDEYQDMSLLQLRIVSMLANQLVVIGDINQQIYAFQGACPEISEQFNKYYPNFKEIILKQSYRCASEIADYATKIVLPNKFASSKLFKGVDREDSYIALHNTSKDLPELLNNIAAEYHTANVKPASHMFLFRNNRSSIAIADMCYELNIPCRVNNYKPLYSQPIMEDIMELVDLLRSPTNPNKLGVLSKYIYEFRDDKRAKSNPLYDYMVANPDLEFFDVPYMYNSTAVPATMEAFKEATDIIMSDKPFIEAFNLLYPILYNNYLKYREFFLSYNLASMATLIQAVLRDYSYTQFLSRETSKAEYINDYTTKRIGVRLYTFHAAKGLEADRIYILDAEDNLLPNSKELENTIKAKAYREAAVTVRNERSLCYVACTRAKTSLDIFFSVEFSSIMRGDNKYKSLDAYYEKTPVNYSDVEHFTEFYS